MLKENSKISFLQGSEIFTVVAKDGDIGNPNPIRYSFEEGKALKWLFTRVNISEKYLNGCFLTR